jgi:hypothetical protein
MDVTAPHLSQKALFGQIASKSEFSVELLAETGTRVTRNCEDQQLHYRFLLSYA